MELILKLCTTYNIIAKVMVKSKMHWHTIGHCGEIIDTIALCKVLNLGLHKSHTLLNDAKSQTEKETWGINSPDVSFS